MKECVPVVRCGVVYLELDSGDTKKKDAQKMVRKKGRKTERRQKIRVK